MCKLARNMAELPCSSHLSWRWNEVLAVSVRKYPTTGDYRVDMPVKQRSNFARRARDFILQGVHLFYKSKIDGSLRLAICSQEVMERVFILYARHKITRMSNHLGCFSNTQGDLNLGCLTPHSFAIAWPDHVRFRCYGPENRIN